MKNIFPFFKAKKKDPGVMERVYDGPRPNEGSEDNGPIMRALYAAPDRREVLSDRESDRPEKNEPPIALVYAGPGQMNKASRSAGRENVRPKGEQAEEQKAEKAGEQAEEQSGEQTDEQNAGEPVKEPVFLCVYAGPAFMARRAGEREEPTVPKDDPTKALKNSLERTPAATPVLRCPGCQIEVPASARFCPECGGKLPDHCLRCGRILASPDAVCPACGMTVL